MRLDGPEKSEKDAELPLVSRLGPGTCLEVWYRDGTPHPYWAWKTAVSTVPSLSAVQPQPGWATLGPVFHAWVSLAAARSSDTCQLWPLLSKPDVGSWQPDPAQAGEAWGQWELASGCCPAATELYPVAATWPH